MSKSSAGLPNPLGPEPRRSTLMRPAESFSIPRASGSKTSLKPRVLSALIVANFRVTSWAIAGIADRLQATQAVAAASLRNVLGLLIGFLLEDFSALILAT